MRAKGTGSLASSRVATRSRRRSVRSMARHHTTPGARSGPPRAPAAALYTAPVPLSPADAARLLDALPAAALWVVAGRIAYANPAAGALLGVPAAELLGRPGNALLRDEEIERVRAR